MVLQGNELDRRSVGGKKKKKKGHEHCRRAEAEAIAVYSKHNGLRVKRNMAIAVLLGWLRSVM